MQVAPGKTTISAPLPIGPIGGAKELRDSCLLAESPATLILGQVKGENGAGAGTGARLQWTGTKSSPFTPFFLKI